MFFFLVYIGTIDPCTYMFYIHGEYGALVVVTRRNERFGHNGKKEHAIKAWLPVAQVGSRKTVPHVRYSREKQMGQEKEVYVLV
jgi:hypothetical protein